MRHVISTAVIGVPVVATLWLCNLISSIFRRLVTEMVVFLFFFIVIPNVTIPSTNSLQDLPLHVRVVLFLINIVDPSVVSMTVTWHATGVGASALVAELMAAVALHVVTAVRLLDHLLTVGA